ncbi:apolipoprotein N-acyltransferase [Kordiimonas sp.]|uniref:apolipoprotein N-acyltransferase n=1 Tax=Kordiimonas sp. TaxID=1970157 RepID=UPI003A9054DA
MRPATMPENNRETRVTGAPFARLFDWFGSKGRFGLPLLAFLNGVLLSRTFAPVNFWPLLFISIPLMILMIDHARTRAGVFGVGWWTGFGLFAVGLNWIGHSFTQQQAVPVLLAPVAILALSAILSLYIGLTFWVTWRLKARGAFRIVIFASCWTLFEVMRSFLFTGFPWHLIGTAWAEWLPMAQASYYIGVYGLSFLTLLAAGSLALVVDGNNRRLWFMWPALGLVFMASIAALGYGRLLGAETKFHLAVSMRLVQANVQQHEKWLAHLIPDHFDKHLKLSRGDDDTGRARGIRLLIWPETTVQRETFDREGSLHRWRISKLLDYGSFAIVGAPRFRATPEKVDFYNSLFAINSKAEIYARYDKTHLVPFGEYLPFEDLLNTLGIAQLTGGSAWSKGAALKTLTLPGVPSFSPLICYEVVFPGKVILKGERPEWILNITNDGWFGMTEGPYQHLAQARLRAIEEGLPLVRSASTGISAVIDPYGRTVTSLGLGKQGVLESPLPRSIEAFSVSSALRVVLAAMLCAFILFARLIYVWRQPEADA